MQWVPGALFLGVKRPRREADHSPRLVSRPKNERIYTSTPPIRLHGVVLSYRKSTGTTLPLPLLYLSEVWWEGVDWMQFAQDGEIWRALVNTVLACLLDGVSQSVRRGQQSGLE
jgi:hypothetical protein